MRSKLWPGLALVLCLTAALCCPLAAAPVYVGVLEQFENDFHLRQVSPAVRVAFVLDGKVWKAMPTAGQDESRLGALSQKYPASVSWTAVFAGQPAGDLVSQRTVFQDGADVGKEQIVSGLASVSPVAGANFTQWIGKAAVRPLVLTSNGHAANPENWQRITPTAEMVAALIPAFRKQIPKVPHCVDTEPKVESQSYTDDKVVGHAAYRAADGRTLVGLKIAQQDSACMQLRDSKEFSTYWFALVGTLTDYVGTEMRPLQAVDIDGDGRCEWIFTRSSFGQDGYVLFYNGFSRKLEFNWNYH